MAGRIEVAYESTAQEIKQAVLNVEATSGQILDLDGNKYVANFDDAFETLALRDVGNRETLMNSFNTIFDTLGTTLNVNDLSFFLYLNDNLRLSYGTVTHGGGQRLWYVITDANTFEVVGGQIVVDLNVITTYDRSAMVDYTVNDRHIWIRVGVGSPAHTYLAIIDLNTYQFKKYVQLKANAISNVVGCLSITNDGSVGILTGAVGGPYLWVFKLTLGADGIPTNTSAAPEYAWSNGDYNAASLFTDGVFFYVSTTPSGAQCKNLKIKFERSNNSFTEVASFTQSGVPNPVPPAVLQYITTNSNGIKLLVRYHASGASNGSYIAVTNLDTFTVAYSSAVNSPTSNLLFDGSNVFIASSPFLQIGSSYYTVIIKFYLNPNASGSLLSHAYYMLANPPSSIGANPTPKVTPTNASIANRENFYLGATQQKPVRVYNLLNYSKEV